MEEALVGAREVEGVEPGVADGAVEQGLVGLLAEVLLVWCFCAREGGGGGRGGRAVALCVEVEAGGGYGEELPSVETFRGEGWLKEGQRASGGGVVGGGDKVVLNTGYAEEGL